MGFNLKMFKFWLNLSTNLNAYDVWGLFEDKLLLCGRIEPIAVVAQLELVFEDLIESFLASGVIDQGLEGQPDVGYLLGKRLA